jgi:hypothetical protein
LAEPSTCYGLEAGFGEQGEQPSRRDLDQGQVVSSRSHESIELPPKGERGCLQACVDRGLGGEASTGARFRTNGRDDLGHLHLGEHEVARERRDTCLLGQRRR